MSTNERTWKVMYTDWAEQDLRSIYEYIAFTLLEPDVAKNQARRIREAINGLDHMPMRFRLYDKEPWHSRGLRVIPVDNYLAFYLPIESKEISVIIRIMYGGRDVETQLSQKDNKN